MSKTARTPYKTKKKKNERTCEQREQWKTVCQTRRSYG